MATPEKIKKHAHRFKDGTWRDYSFEELADWVHLMTKRANHRTEFVKVVKDLDDAENYLAIMNAKLAEARLYILTQWEDETKKNTRSIIKK